MAGDDDGAVVSVTDSLELDVLQDWPRPDSLQALGPAAPPATQTGLALVSGTGASRRLLQGTTDTTATDGTDTTADGTAGDGTPPVSSLH